MYLYIAYVSTGVGEKLWLCDLVPDTPENAGPDSSGRHKCTKFSVSREDALLLPKGKQDDIQIVGLIWELAGRIVIA